MNHSCPLCDAPYLKTLTRETPKEPTRTHVFECGNRAHRYSEGSTDLHEPTDMCRARQRLRDDVLARCMAGSAVESYLGNNPNGTESIATRWLCTLEEAVVRAVVTVAAVYPLPVKAKSEGPTP